MRVKLMWSKVCDDGFISSGEIHISDLSLVSLSNRPVSDVCCVFVVRFYVSF
jgi:hypothetical protein